MTRRPRVEPADLLVIATVLGLLVGAAVVVAATYLGVTTTCRL